MNRPTGHRPASQNRWMYSLILVPLEERDFFQKPLIHAQELELNKTEDEMWATGFPNETTFYKLVLQKQLHWTGWNLIVFTCT